MQINRQQFFAGYRSEFGALKQNQVDGLNALISSIEADTLISDVRHIAYMLATTKHETAHTFAPISEYGHGRGREYGHPDPATGQTYYGRGFVQLTWKRNYQLFSDRLGLDLVNHPDEALRPEAAYAIMSLGMRKGLFTGKALSHYINDMTTDYRSARRIINGIDCADVIAGYARQFEKILRTAGGQS